MILPRCFMPILVIGLAAPGAGLVALALPAHAAATCHGIPATIESAGDITGTPERDVIVSTGGPGTSVEALAGDDIICVHNGAEIHAGTGTDVVDASQVPVGSVTRAFLGEDTNTYVGGPGSDIIYGGPDYNYVTTARGADEFYRSVRAFAHPLDIVDLGPGRDYARIAKTRRNFAGELVMGDGRDEVDVVGRLETWSRVVVDNQVNGYISAKLGHIGRMRFGGAEHLNAIAGEVVIESGGGNDRLTATGCHLHVEGGDGEDLIEVKTQLKEDKIDCEKSTSVLMGQLGSDRIDGGPGDDWIVGAYGPDVMRGGSGDDVLIGGPGIDRGNGDLGRDTCSAERTRNC